MPRFVRIVPKAVLEEKLYGIDEEPDSNTIPVWLDMSRSTWPESRASTFLPNLSRPTTRRRSDRFLLSETRPGASSRLQHLNSLRWRVEGHRRMPNPTFSG